MQGCILNGKLLVDMICILWLEKIQSIRLCVLLRNFYRRFRGKRHRSIFAVNLGGKSDEKTADTDKSVSAVFCIQARVEFSSSVTYDLQLYREREHHYPII